MMGTPIIGVMALMGIMPCGLHTLAKAHSRAMTAPARMVAGTRRAWLLVPSDMRAMCGTTSPMKPMGPQKAVTTAVKMPVMSNRMLRVLETLTPRLRAYRVPSNKAFNGLTMRAEPINAKMIMPA